MNGKKAKKIRRNNKMGTLRSLMALAVLGPDNLRKLEKERLVRLPKWFTQTPMFANISTEMPVWPGWSLDKAIKEGLKQSVWVYRCNRIIASNVSAVKWYVEERKSIDEWNRIPGHPLELLLRKPNPRMSGQDIQERLSYHLQLGGNGIWHKVLINGMPVELWPLMPDKMRPVPDENGNLLKNWIYQPFAGEKIPIEPGNITHFMFVDPSNIFWGLSPLMAGAKVVDTDLAAVEWQKVSLGNRCVSDGAFIFKHPLKKDEWIEAKKQVTEQHNGPANARAPWVLGADADWKPMSLTPAEMDFINSRNMGMYEIHAIFGVDPLLTGAPDRSGRANKKEAKRSLWEETLIPYLDDIKSAMNEDLIPYWDPQATLIGAEPNLRIVYDLSHIPALRELILEKARTALMFSKMKVPFDKINERLDLGFSEFEGWDEVIQTPAPVVNGGGDAETEPIKTKDIEPALKSIYWKELDNIRSKWEDEAVEKVKGLLDREGTRVTKAYSATGSPKSATGAIKESEWRSGIEVLGTAVVEFFGQQEANLIQAQAKSRKAVNFDTSKRRIQDAIKKNAVDKAVEITSTSKEKIAKIIADGVKKDLTNIQISREIRDQYKRWTDPAKETGITTSRAMTITRTEVLGGSSFGTDEGARQAGEELDLKMGKGWVDSGDGNVRALHRNVNSGKVIAQDKTFDNGLMFPGQFGGEASNVINCRCVVFYKVIGRK